MALLVDAQHQGALGRRQVEADDVAYFLDEERVAGELEGLAAVRLQSERLPDPIDGRRRMANRRRLRAQAPMGPVGRRVLQGAANHLGDRVVTDLARRPGPRRVKQSIEPSFGEPPECLVLVDGLARAICIERGTVQTLAMMTWVFTRLFVCVGIMSIAACAQHRVVPRLDTEAAAEAPAGPTASQFQLELDRQEIAFTVPPVGKSILVNIPAFEVIAFEDGTPVLRSRVVVGTPRNPTPIMQSYTTAVRFRPTWRPTPSMVASGEYADRRVPAGRNNPLGLAAVRLEPGLLIYLHDTNRRHLFAEADRARSHGCVRVERWDELMAWLLDEEPSTIHDWAEGRRTFDVPTPPVPVTLGYYTAFPGDDGNLLRFDDIYQRHAPSAPIPASATVTDGIAG